MPRTIVGIDLGSYSIKLTKLSASFGRFDLIDSREETILPEENTIPELLGRILGDFVSEHELRTGIFVCDLPGDLITSRIIDLPFKSHKKISETLPFEIENHIPLPLEDLIIDYSFIEQQEESSQVLALVTKKQSISELLDEVGQAGVDPKFIEGDFTSLSHLVPLIDHSAEEPFMLLDIGHHRTSMCFAVGDKVVFMRSARVGGELITKEISRALDLSYKDAEELKHAAAFWSNDPDIDSRVKEAAETVLGEILGEIRSTINQLKSLKIPTPGKIFLCGGQARMHGLDSYLSESLNISVEPLALDVEKEDKNGASGEQAPEVHPVSLGLALRGLDQARDFRINFRREEFVFKSEHEVLKKYSQRIGILTAVLIVLFFVNIFYRGNVEKTRVDDYKAQIRNIFVQTLPDVRKIVDENHQLRTEINSFRTRVESLGSLAGGGITITYILGEIASLTEDLDIEVWDFSFEGNKVTLQAQTNSYKTIDDIKTKLETGDRFSKVEYSDAKTSSSGNEVKFKMTIELNTE
jgi:general secretion pathway protein L